MPDRTSNPLRLSSSVIFATLRNSSNASSGSLWIEWDSAIRSVSIDLTAASTSAFTCSFSHPKLKLLLSVTVASAARAS